MEPRVCTHPGCTTKLARDNRGTLCAFHEHQRAEAALPPIVSAPTTKRKEVIRLEGARLIPEKTLPNRSRLAAGIYPQLIAEFLASGEAIARVEVDGRKHHSIYSALESALNGETRCYPTCRQKRCYLVRVPERR